LGCYLIKIQNSKNDLSYLMALLASSVQTQHGETFLYAALEKDDLY
jgi:hypothetical protein